jgi:uncharacterized DUF497 family protein
MSAFDWDEGNLNHIARHGVTSAEVEQVFNWGTLPFVRFTHIQDGEERFQAFGITAHGRYLTVAYIERNGLIRPISARDMDRKEKKAYGPKIHEN